MDPKETTSRGQISMGIDCLGKKERERERKRNKEK